MSVKHVDITNELQTGIYNVLNNFIFKEVDEITLTGTSGTASILHNGVTKTATWHTSLTVTASDFVTANAAAYLVAGSVLTSVGAKLIFTANVPGVGFTGATTITNLTLTLSGTKVANDVTYPIYINMPKKPADIYIHIGGVIQTEDGTKDEFIYEGTAQLKITSVQMDTDETKVQQILNVIRGLLLPTKGSVFSIGTKTLVRFSPESLNPMTEQSDEGICKVSLIDIYNYSIN